MRWTTVALGVFLLTSPTLASPASYRTLRYTHVVGQTDWYTCGAAAVATLLTYYYEDPVTEGEVLEVAMREMEASRKDLREGLTALSLKRYLEGRGYEVRAYRVGLDELADYFRRGGLPVVAHVTRPELHFLVVVGVLDLPSLGLSQVLLADPSWGRKIVPLSALVSEKGFSGVVLLTLPRSAVQMERVKANQKAELSWALSRLRRLEALGGRGP
jgi:predicted double-glycine peptidase